VVIVMMLVLSSMKCINLFFGVLPIAAPTKPGAGTWSTVVAVWSELAAGGLLVPTFVASGIDHLSI
jgi:hypothetical protein